MVPVPSVVVVVVVVCDTCAHANGAANANAMLNITFFIFPFLVPSLPTPNRSNLPHHQSVSVLRGKYDRRLPGRRCGLKDAGFNSVRRTRIPRYSKNMEITTCGSKRSFQDFLRNTSTSFGCSSNACRYCRSNARRAFSTVLPMPTIPFSRLCPSKTMNVPRRRLSCGRRTALGLRGWRVQ
jgi:hypothetical protein